MLASCFSKWSYFQLWSHYWNAADAGLVSERNCSTAASCRDLIEELHWFCSGHSSRAGLQHPREETETTQAVNEPTTCLSPIHEQSICNLCWQSICAHLQPFTAATQSLDMLPVKIDLLCSRILVFLADIRKIMCLVPSEPLCNNILFLNWMYCFKRLLIALHCMLIVI